MHIIHPINDFLFEPDDYVTMTLIAINLIQNGKADTARQYLDRAFDVNPAYPNIYNGFALLAEAEHNSREAFEMSVVALFKNPKKDLLYQQSLNTAMKVASEIIDEEVGGDIVNSYASTLEEECGKKIVIETDAGLKSGAKIEFAENRGGTYHLVKYNPEYPAVHHLLMHELTHLHFAAQAQQAGKNMRFLGSLEHDAMKLSKKGFDDAVIRLNGQIFNTPIDLYIEDYLFQNYPALMPYQFLSLIGLVQDGIHATTDEQILAVAPPVILSKSKTFNLVNALFLMKRYGVNLIEEHQPTAPERELAETFYCEYEECRTRHTPGDEYELLQSWAKQLHLQNCFSLAEESGFPLYTEAHQGKDINMAVTRFMVEALHYFKNLTILEINNIAIQTGVMCGEGITPDAKGYSVPLMPGKTFTGYQVLAYYYVSWAKAFPEKLLQLKLPFDKEYAFSQEMAGMGGS